MLQFLRKHQKYFFVIVTFFIVMSFLFFGTYQVIAPIFRTSKDKVAFVALDGKSISQSHLDQMSRFLSTVDHFNDDCIAQEFFETNMALMIFDKQADHFREELTRNFEREKHFAPYVHPQAKFLSAANVWGIFAPSLQENLTKLQQMEDGTTQEAFKTRIALYLAEKHFPSTLLSYVLRQQQQEYPGIQNDPRLMREQLTLFGYHDLKDWFGSAFIEDVAKVVIQGSLMARAQGITVTRREVLTDLLSRNEKVFQAEKEHLPESMRNSRLFFSKYLHMRGFDEESMVAIWQEVMLFKRLFHDAAHHVLIDTLPMKEFYACAGQSASLELYQMAEELKLQTSEDLKRFEAYLQAVSEKRANPLELPTHYDSLEEIAQRAPEVIGREFTLDVTQVAKNDLQGKVTVKQTWEWQVDERNFEKLKVEFPELALKKHDDLAMRTLALDEMDPRSRALVDKFARLQIIDEHPEWLEGALSEGMSEEKRAVMTHQRSDLSFEGITDFSALRAKLDSEESINHYTQDGKTFYNMKVKQRAPEKILSFVEAKTLGITEELVKKQGCDERFERTLGALFAAAQKEGLETNFEEFRVRAPAYRFMGYLSTYPVGERENPLFKVVKKEEKVARGKESLISLLEATQAEKGAFSDVKVSPEHGAYFYRVSEITNETLLPSDKLLKAEELLSKETKCHLLEELYRRVKDV